MSAAAAPPPPPPPGGSSKGGPGHNSPASNKDSPPIGPRDRGDGASAKTAWWTYGLWSNPNQAHYLVNRGRMQPPYQWVRCTQGEARYDFDTGYPIYRIVNGTARRIGTVTNQDALNRARGDPFYDHFRQIEQEERDRVSRHELIGYEEDIIEDLDEEYEDQDPNPFDKAMSPSRGGSGTFPGHRSTSSTGAPSTPHPRGPGSVSSPLSPNRQNNSGSSPLLPGFTSPRGTGPTSSPRTGGAASSPRGDGSASSPPGQGFAPTTPRHQRDASGNAGSSGGRRGGGSSGGGRGSGGSSQRRRQGQDPGSPGTPSGGSGPRRSADGGT